MRQWRGPLSVGDKAHPIVQKLFREMNKQQIGLLDMAERSGVNKNTLKDWRLRTVPTVDNLEACFNVLGLSLTTTASKEYDI